MEEFAFTSAYTLRKSLSIPSLHLITNTSHTHVGDNSLSEPLTDSKLWLHIFKHSVHVDHIDAGVKRNHHYLIRRLSQYRKAFSDNCIGKEETSSDEDERGGGASGNDSTVSGSKLANILTDLNNNLVNGLLLPMVKLGSFSSQFQRQTHTISFTQESRAAPIKKVLSENMLKEPVESLSYRQTTES